MGRRDATLVFQRDESVTLMSREAICMPRLSALVRCPAVNLEAALRHR